MRELAAELSALVDQAPRLLVIGNEAAGASPPAGGWSRKEILGHLIDSAANNHQRFVRLQHEATLQLPGYSQNDWVRTQNYRQRPWAELVDLWAAYNRHLAHVIVGIDPGSFHHVWTSPGGPVTLEFIAGDYVRHLRHHLEQILGGL